MSTLTVEIDDATLGRLHRLGPATGRPPAEIIAEAIRKAVWELEERATAAAYASQPDREPEAFDPETWENETA